MHGCGYSTESNAVRTEVVGFKTTHPPVGPTAGIHIESFFVYSSRQYAKVLEASSNVGLTFSGATVEMGFDLSQRLAIQKNTLHIVVLARHESSPLQPLGGATLLQYAKETLRNEGPKAFYTVFGDRWVS